MNQNTYPYLFKGVLMAILIFIVEYILLAFVKNSFLLLFLVTIVLLVTHHVLLESSLRYKACLMATCLTILAWSGLTLLIKNNGNMTGLQYSNVFWGVVVFNWLIPYLYCFIRQYIDCGPRFPDYNKYFIGMTIVLLIPFTIGFIYLNYINPNFFNIYHPTKYMYIPFYMTATYIENIMDNTIKASSFLTYIALYILLFLPIGYHGRLLTRSMTLAVRVAFGIGVCVVAEAIKVPLLHTFNIDNILYSFLGLLIGCGLFALVDYKHYQRKDEKYLHKSTFNFTYRY